MTQDHLRKDFFGRMVCDNCWSGLHEMNKTDPATGKTRMKVSACLGHGCECLCLEVAAQKRARRARDHYTIADPQ